MDRDRLQILSTLVVTILLIVFAGLMVTVVPGPGADTLGATIITAVVTRWLTQGAQQQAEKTAEKVQEALTSNVASAIGGNGTTIPTNPVETTPNE